ncbi:protein NRT1/ PTR FAMILY 2.7-like [Salvia miltiorrhiza]|uniref:protein NRT1/ PTR FAMILY 2.7-like n=1 Tax=Salvia miltiorrhiza TaxID=226208 RepID=UPI0025AD0010|nr:protein NRT1/ PTR FAMILY 2.7-like [Salvia miltiorrhiza]
MASLHASVDNNTSLSGDREAPPPTAAPRRRGGWITTPFIIATVFGLTVAAGGWSGNLIVFLINEFNIKRIDAAQISNVVNGCVNFFPLLAAVAADSLFGCFSVIWISSLISLLGIFLLLLTVAADGLKPAPSEPASRIQYAVLYSGMALASIGMGGTRFTLATMGANQIKHKATFFNWYFFSLYSASFISATAIVYVEDNVGWRWGFGIAIAANALALALFLVGAPYYSRDEPRASPFTALLRVAVAAFRKRKAVAGVTNVDYYYGDDGVKGDAPTNWFSQLNRAAVKLDGDILPNGVVAAPWRLCTVQQVEDLKTLMRILPLWSSSIFLGTPIGVQLSLTVLQSLASDRRLSAGFTFPAGSIIVFSFVSTAVGVILIDRCFRPSWRRMVGGKELTPLQQIGIGHVFNVASMAVSALVESRRRRRLMSVMWLVPQMVVVGVGEAFHFPGQVGLYYQEFPASLKGVATAMVAMLVGVAFYLSTAVVDFIRRVTHWLPDDIDHGRLDYVYWVMVVIGIANFGYFLVIACLYHYKNEEVVIKKDEKA